jgi:hypothetical protein
MEIKVFKTYSMPGGHTWGYRVLGGEIEGDMPVGRHLYLVQGIHQADFPRGFLFVSVLGFELRAFVLQSRRSNLGAGGSRPVIPATQEAETRTIAVQSQPRHIVLETLCFKKLS